MTGGRLEILVSTVQNTVYRVEGESHLKILGVGGRAWAGAYVRMRVGVLVVWCNLTTL